MAVVVRHAHRAACGARRSRLTFLSADQAGFSAARLVLAHAQQQRWFPVQRALASAHYYEAGCVFQRAGLSSANLGHVMAISMHGRRWHNGWIL